MFTVLIGSDDTRLEELATLLGPDFDVDVLPVGATPRSLLKLPDCVIADIQRPDSLHFLQDLAGNPMTRVVRIAIVETAPQYCGICGGLARDAFQSRLLDVVLLAARIAALCEERAQLLEHDAILERRRAEARQSRSAHVPVKQPFDPIVN